MKNQLNVVGIMSGTSLDAVDFILCEVTKDIDDSGKERFRKIIHLDTASVSFSSKLRKSLLQSAQNELTTYTLAELHFDLGRFYAKSLKKIATQKKWKIDLIGLHGQTVYHHRKKSTLQIGEASFLAEAFQCPVIHQFRNLDIARDGEGAPLAPVFHAIAFGKKNHSLAVHNLGGISNLSLIVDAKIECAYDTGPANMPMDYVMQTRAQKSFDRDGKLAAKGQPNETLVKQVLQHPYFNKSFPKSCGREEFGVIWMRNILKKYKTVKLQDLLASLTEAVAISIANEYKKLKKYSVEEIYFSGGGAKNKFLLERIQSHLPHIKIRTVEEKSWSSQDIEGAAFALLATLRWWQIPIDLKKITGAKRAGFLGQIVIAGADLNQ